MICLNRWRENPFLSGTAAGSDGTMYEVEVYAPTGPYNRVERTENSHPL